MTSDRQTGESLRNDADRKFLISLASLWLSAVLAFGAAAWIWRQGLEDVPQVAIEKPLVAVLVYPPSTAMMVASILAVVGITAYIKSSAYHTFERQAYLGALDEDE